MLGVLGWASAVGVGTHAMHFESAAISFIVGLGVVPLAFVISYRERNGFLESLALDQHDQTIGAILLASAMA